MYDVSSRKFLTEGMIENDFKENWTYFIDSDAA